MGLIDFHSLIVAGSMIPAFYLSIPAPQLDCNDPPGGIVGTPYSHQITIDGGTPPYTVTISSGALPTGLAIDDSGLITGTPTTAGTFGFTVNAVDAAAEEGEVSCSITIASVLVLACNSPASGTVGVAYSHGLTLSGGTPPYTVTISSGALPDGLSIDNTGLISGTPTLGGIYSFDVFVADDGSQTATVTCSITIAVLDAGCHDPDRIRDSYATMIQPGIYFAREII